MVSGEQHFTWVISVRLYCEWYARELITRYRNIYTITSLCYRSARFLGRFNRPKRSRRCPRSSVAPCYSLHVNATRRRVRPTRVWRLCALLYDSHSHRLTFDDNRTAASRTEFFETMFSRNLIRRVNGWTVMQVGMVN